jgi:zinc transport system permease protein
MLGYAYMRRALVAGFMLSIMIPLIGVVMVNRKTSMVGDTLAHSSLPGVAMGLILGWDPVLTAIIACVVAALAIENIRERFPEYGDMATAVVLSLALGIAAILTSFTPGGNTLESYLFGGITSVLRRDVIMTAVVFVLVVLFSVIYYSGLLDIAIDVNLARLSGVPVKFINTAFTILSAVTIGLAVKIVGALLVMSMMVLPVATSLMVTRSYKTTVIMSVILGIIYMMVGIVISYFVDIKPGGTIVLNAIIGMLIIGTYSRVRKVYTKEQVK